MRKELEAFLNSDSVINWDDSIRSIYEKGWMTYVMSMKPEERKGMGTISPHDNTMLQHYWERGYLDAQKRAMESARKCE